MSRQQALSASERVTGRRNAPDPTPEPLAALRAAQTPRKYRNEPTVVDGTRFASKREATRYLTLTLRARAGEIADLELQPRYPICVRGQRVCEYRADFRYRVVATGATVVEDAKGVRTAVYRLKKRLMRACYGIEIQEV